MFNEQRLLKQLLYSNKRLRIHWMECAICVPIQESQNKYYLALLSGGFDAVRKEGGGGGLIIELNVQRKIPGMSAKMM